MKAGELAGIADLALDVAPFTLPRLIVPPRSERDPDQPTLLILQNEPDLSAALVRHWGQRECFIDATYLIDECGRGRLADWLPGLFSRARAAGASPIPMATLSDLTSDQTPAYCACIDRSAELQFGIVIPSSELDNPESKANLQAALNALGIQYANCAVVADFSDADLSTPSFVEPIIRAILESLQQIGLWRHVIFQGTHFPEVNPAADDSTMRWPRNEWLAWRLSVRFDPQTAEHLMFGDYAADCAKMEFKKGGARAHRHYRYATGQDWLVVRAAKEGRDQQLMQGVCSKIIASGDFAGAGFSSADAYIALTASGASGPGTATMWRQINTTHHITRVIADLGTVRGIKIARREVAIGGVQLSLLNV